MTSALKNLLIVDDVPAFCRELKAMLPVRMYRCTVCTDPTRVAVLLAKKNYDLVISTVVMRKMGGFDLIRTIRGEGHSMPIMLITGYGSQKSAIEAQRMGVSDYLYKPVVEEELRARVDRVLAKAAPTADASGAIKLDKLVSRDPAMLSIFETVITIAGSDSRVLILGETGTGKQLIAQAIHSLSARKSEPFVEVNCAAIPENLLESEFFGHERGAFTGAVSRRIGRFEEAREGTLFLDEIGEVDYALQAKLLRVLEDGRYNRVGAGTTLHSRARVIAATNRDLRAASEDGRFRADLFYRLHVISVTVPPLRERKADVPLLTDYFLNKYLSPGRSLEFSEEALEAMAAYRWPGNVRELEHLVERFSVLHPGPLVRIGDLPDHMRSTSGESGHLFGPGISFREARTRFEKKYVENALKLNDGKMAAASRAAQMDRAQFFRLVRRHNIDPQNL